MGSIFFSYVYDLPKVWGDGKGHGSRKKLGMRPSIDHGCRKMLGGGEAIRKLWLSRVGGTSIF